MVDREYMRSHNNSTDPNKHGCGLAVAEHLGVADVTYLHTVKDLTDAISMKYDVQVDTYRGSSRRTMGRAKKELIFMTQHTKPKVVGFLFGVRARVSEKTFHAVYTDGMGQVIVDTDPRVSDRRAVYYCYIIMNKED